MQTRSRSFVVLAAFIGVLALAAVASTLFVAQGGFGAGHGRFDQALFFLGLPWLLILVVIPWPESLWLGDYAMIVLLPFVCNLAVVLVLWAVLTRRR
jgi:hypothetical protein